MRLCRKDSMKLQRYWDTQKPDVYTNYFRRYESISFRQLQMRLITLVKDTSLAFTIGVTEMFTMAKALASGQTSMVPYAFAAMFYYVLNLVVAIIMERIERKVELLSVGGKVMSLLEMKNVKKSLEESKYLKDISLKVEKGEVLGIIGPSGSGKSTLLRCATGLETPDDGEINYWNIWTCVSEF